MGFRSHRAIFDRIDHDVLVGKQFPPRAVPGRKAGALKRGPINPIAKGKDRTPCVGVSIRLSLRLRRHGVERIPHKSSLPQAGGAQPETSAQHFGHSTGTFQMSRAYSLMARSEENQAMLAVLRMPMRVQADAERHSWSIRRCVP